MSRATAAQLVRSIAAAVAVALVMLIPVTALAQGEPADETYYEDTDPSAVTEFRDVLDPHGAWVDDPVYGTVWVPDVVVVGEGFQPYNTAGRWAVADDGSWVWVSDYSWGYVPFHYGRWVWISGRGWAWIPGRRYAPAWVVWRVGEPGWDYVGWAPMGPSFIWVDGYAVGYWHVGVLPFWFVPGPWLFHHHWHHHVVPPHRHSAVAGHTHVHAGSGRHGASPTSSSASDGHQGASPTAGSSPRVGTADGPPRHSIASEPPSSPTFEEARIPAGARPKDRVAVDPRAKSLATRPSGSVGAPRGASSGRGSNGRSVGPANRSALSPGRTGAARSPSAGARRSSSPGAPGWKGSMQRRPAPSRAWSPPRSNRSYGSYGSPSPSSRSAPARSSGSSTRSAPARSGSSSSWGRSPSRSSSPSRSVSAPRRPSRSVGPAPSSSSKRKSSSSKKSSGSGSTGKSRGRSGSRRR